MNYRSIADMNDTIVRNLHRLPDDIDLVVGIPRSGLLAANLFSLVKNIPMADLDGFVAGRTYSAGVTKRGSALGRKLSEMRKVLVLDDSINGGDAMRAARAKIMASGTNAPVIFAAVYGAFEQYGEADFIFEVVPWPRMFQWNFMHHKYLEQSCVDLDGVLRLDPARAGNGEGPAGSVAEAQPLYRPTRKIGYLVTGLGEEYRARTEAWLAAHGTDYGRLVMCDRPAAPGGFKAEFYRLCDAELFIEGDPGQAAGIARLSGKPVLCTATQEMIPANPLKTQWKQARTAEGRQALLKLTARTVLGETGYGALKRWARGSA